MVVIVFHLYVAGASSHSKKIFEFYKEACDVCIKNAYKIEVIDILKKPLLAEKHKVLATPTMSRSLPAPEKRIIGKVNEEQARMAIQFLTEDILTS